MHQCPKCGEPVEKECPYCQEQELKKFPYRLKEGTVSKSEVVPATKFGIYIESLLPEELKDIKLRRHDG